MIPNMLPADELASVRAQIRTLEAREAELRNGFLSGALNPRGQYVSVEIKPQSRRTLDREALPRAIKEDPAFWRVTKVNSVVLRKIGAESRDAIRRGARDEPHRTGRGFARG